MKTIRRDGGTISAPGRSKDDLVMAAGLAAAAFAEQVQPQLIGRRITREVSNIQQDYTPEQLSVGKNVSNYLKNIGFGPDGR